MERVVSNSKVSEVGNARVLLTDTSRWALAARLAMGLADAGCHITALCPAHGHPLHKTRAVQRTYPYSGLRPLESLIVAIEATDPQIIIPCDDRGVQHLHELYVRACDRDRPKESLAALIRHSLGAPDSFPVVSSRYQLLRIAREQSLRVPDTKLVRSVDDLSAWQSVQPLPWVLKADGTWGGRGVKIAHTVQQAHQFFVDLTQLFGAGRAIKRFCVNRDSFWFRPWYNRANPAVTVQSYIHGRPANCSAVCWQGEVLAAIAVEVVSAQGLTGPASIVRVVDSPEMMLCAERIASRLGLSGFFGLDFMIEDANDACWLIEMNPRCAPPCHLQLGKGRDLIGALCARISGQPFRETSPVTERNTIAYFPQAWNSGSELLQSSFHDVPQNEPELVQDLLHPWPDRSLLFRLANQLHEITTSKSSIIVRNSSSYNGSGTSRGQN